ncbi:MAG TPA: ABC transporter permease, partial [Thermoanaerobaculia bacterium]
MSLRDLLRLAWGSLRAHRLRSRLTVLGIVIGIASVILLTSLGEGARRTILADFTQFGTNIMAINKGRRTTSGIPGLGGTVRRLTVEDAAALRRVRGVELVLCGAYGTARVEFGERG